MAVHAADTKGTSTADGTLTVRGFNDNRVPARDRAGRQSDRPSRCAVAPRAAGRVARCRRRPRWWAPRSPSKRPAARSFPPPLRVTDANGQAETLVRLQNAEGVTLVRADAPAVAFSPVTFGLRSAAASLSNFPKFQQAGDTKIGSGTATIAQKGALLTAVAAILRYHQNRGELGAPNGSADPAALNQFLTAYCPTDVEGHPDLRRLPGRLQYRGAGGQSLACGRIHRRRRCGGGGGDSGGHRGFPGARLSGAAFARHVPERCARGRPLRGGHRASPPMAPS